MVAHFGYVQQVVLRELCGKVAVAVRVRVDGGEICS